MLWSVNSTTRSRYEIIIIIIKMLWFCRYFRQAVTYSTKTLSHPSLKVANEIKCTSSNLFIPLSYYCIYILLRERLIQSSYNELMLFWRNQGIVISVWSNWKICYTFLVLVDICISFSPLEPFQSGNDHVETENWMNEMHAL